MPNNKERIDWSDTLKKYGTPTIFKEKLLKPYFENVILSEPILDVGCGTGYFSSLLCNRNYQILGIDVSGQLESDKKFNFKNIDFAVFETEQKFETILLINILTTLPPKDRLQIIQKIKDIKTGAGTAYVVNTNAELVNSDFDSEILSCRKIGDSRVHLKVRLIDGQYIEFDDYIVTAKEMEKLCEEVGLEIVEKIDFKSEELKKPIYEMYLLR